MAEGIPATPFIVGEQYTRNDIYRVMQVPIEQQRGNWETGYTRWGNDLFIFPTVGSAATGGFDYANRWEGDAFVWYAKNGTSLEQPLIQWMLGNAERVFVFTRPAVRTPFTFEGLGRVRQTYDESPVRIDWELFDPADAQEAAGQLDQLPGELDESTSFWEGAVRQVTVNAYERDGKARKACLKHFGCRCCVCELSFAEKYGNIGEGFIHVHHIRELASIGQEYEVNPIEDLRPVCPNCHAMLHSEKPALSVERLRELLLELNVKQDAERPARPMQSS